MDASDPILPQKALVPRGPSTYETLRRLLVVGATSVVKLAKGPKQRGPHWLIELLKRKSPKLAAVALANKTARIAWKLMTTGESYNRARIDAAAPTLA